MYVAREGIYVYEKVREAGAWKEEKEKKKNAGIKKGIGAGK